jgi:hypothetical protein
MPVISNASFRVVLPSGNAAIYIVQPQHVPRNDIPASIEWPRMYGEQIAHELSGRWYRPGGWDEITDARTLALIERCPEL